MKITTISYASFATGKELIACLYEPEEKPRGIVQILHGLAEHVGRYRAFAEFLTSKGYVVAAADHLGHGVVTKEEDRGFFAEKDGWHTVSRDAVTLAEEVKERYPDLPYYLFGHSMGSFMARYVYLKGMTDLDGLILSGTGNLSPVIVAGGKAVGQLERLRLGGKNKVSSLVTSLALGPYDKPFAGEGKNAWISSLPEEVARYNSDPLCGFPVKLGMFLDMFDGISYIIQKKNIAKADKSVPILLVAGANDPVGNMGKGVRAAYDAFCRAGVEDVSMLLYDGCRHEILNDTCKEKAMDDIAAWLGDH